MNSSALVFMLIVWGIIFCMTGYCFYKLMTSKRQLGGDD